MLQFAVALNVVLTSGKVPHEVTPIHEVTLVRHEEADVLQERRHLDGDNLTATVVVLHRAVNASHPVFISLCMVCVVHTWEKHILCVDILVLRTHGEISVFLLW